MRRSTIFGLLVLVAVLGLAGPAQAQGIDVTEVGWDRLDFGQDTTFHAVVENDGQVERTVDVTFEVPGAGYSETNQSVTIPVDGSANVTAGNPWQPVEGQDEGAYTLEVTAEDELQEDQRTREFEIGPDVVMRDLRVETANPVEGQAVEFVADIENVADDRFDAEETFDVTFALESGEWDTEVSVDGLRAKSSKEVTATWPQASEGSFTVVAEANPGGTVAEVTADNNDDDASFSVRPALPDLVVTEIGPADPYVEDGGQTPIQATVENQGTAPVEGDFPVRFRVDGSTHGPDIHEQVSELGVGQSVTATSTSWSASAGHHDLVAIADPGNENVTESVEDNNKRASELHVGPDLVVSDIPWTPDPAAAGAEVDIEPLVRNQGTVNVTEGSTVEVRIPSQEKSWPVDIGPLAAGNTTQVHAATWEPPEEATGYPYDLEIEAEADVDGEAEEIDDANNQRVETMTVTEPLPDVVATHVRLDPARPDSGQQAQIQATIWNNGSAEADEIDVEFRVDGEPIGERKTIEEGIGTLEAGESREVTSDAWTPSTGQPTLAVLPDPEGNVTEVREDNNNASREVLVGPDAVVETIASDPEAPEADDDVSFEITVGNAGTEAIQEVNVTVEIDGEPLGEETVEQLDSDGNTTIEIPWEATEGDHTVSATVDPDDEIQEAVEDNNDQDLSFSTGASPDVQISSIQWSEDPRQGDKLLFSAQVTNAGTADVGGSFTVSFHIDGQPIGTDDVDGLPEGDAKTVSSQTWSASAGTHTIRVLADADDDVKEDDEDDNERTETLTVTKRETSDDGDGDEGPANLLVTSLSPPDDVQPDDKVTFLATIENAGGQRAPASEVRFQVDDEALGEREIGALEPGQRASVASDEWNATQGEHTFTAIADALDDVDESDEDDNERAKTIQVGDVEGQPPADGERALSLGPVGTSQTPRAGEPVGTTVQVTNRGEEAVDLTVTFYVDGTRLGEASLQGLQPGEETELAGPEWEPTEGEHTLRARSGTAQAETIVDVEPGDEPTSVPAPGLALLVASLLAASLARRRR